MDIERLKKAVEVIEEWLKNRKQYVGCQVNPRDIALRTALSLAQSVIGGSIFSTKGRLRDDGQYQCEHIDKDEISGNCVWCALTLAEKGLKYRGKVGEMMSEGGIANLIPLNWRELSLQDLVYVLFGHISAREKENKMPSSPSNFWKEASEILIKFENKSTQGSDGYTLKEALEALCILREKETPARKEISESSEDALRRYLWASHGHRGLYGDNGEMQCGECCKFGALDYKKDPIDDVIKAAINAREDVNYKILTQAPTSKSACKLSREELIEIIMRKMPLKFFLNSEGQKEWKKFSVKLADAILSSGKEVCPECHATGYDLQCKVCSGTGTLKKEVSDDK